MPLVLYVNTALPANNVGQLVDLVKASPGKYSYASGGSGSPHASGGRTAEAGAPRGPDPRAVSRAGPALSDVLAGQVPIAFETTTALAPRLKSGRVRPLAHHWRQARPRAA